MIARRAAYLTYPMPSFEIMKRVLGIDVGNVIIGGGGEDTSFFSNNYLRTPALDGVFEVLPRIVPKFDDVVIISKCGNRVRNKTMEWMKHYDFHTKTGIGVDKFNFCYKREDKAWIAQFWEVTHYLDDRMDIINSMRGVVPNLFLFAPNVRATVTQGGFHIVPSWAAFERLLEVLDKRSKA